MKILNMQKDPKEKCYDEYIAKEPTVISKIKDSSKF